MYLDTLPKPTSDRVLVELIEQPTSYETAEGLSIHVGPSVGTYEGLVVDSGNVSVAVGDRILFTRWKLRFTDGKREYAIVGYKRIEGIIKGDK